MGVTIPSYVRNLLVDGMPSILKILFYHQTTFAELYDGTNLTIFFLGLPLVTFKTPFDGTKILTQTIFLEVFVPSIRYGKFFNGKFLKKEVN